MKKPTIMILCTGNSCRSHLSERPLTKHPESGEAIRRVVLGGFGVLSSKGTSGDSGGGCGPSCGSH